MKINWENFRVNFTVITVIIIFVINYAAQYLLYSNQDVLAQEFFGSTSPDAIANIRWMIGASLLVCAATMIFWGYFGDKYSKKWVLILSSIIWITACYFIFFIPNISYSQLFLSQIFFGLGFGAVWPICFSLLGDVVKPERRGLVFSTVSLLVGLGPVIGLFLGSIYAFAWRMPFLIISILGTGLIGIFSILGIDLKKGGAEHELKTVLDQGAVYSYGIKREHLKTLWKKGINVNLFLQGIPGCIPWAVLLIVAPTFFHSLGFDKDTAVLIIIFSQAPSALGTFFGGWYADRLVRKSQTSRLKFLIICLVLPIPFIIAAFLLPYSAVGPDAGFGVFWTTPLYPLGFLLIGIGSFFSPIPGNNYFAVIEAANEPELRSTIISFQKVNDNLGSAIGPGLAAILSVFFSGIFSERWGDPFTVAVAILFWIPCAYFWTRAGKTIEQDVQQMQDLLKERAKELEQYLK